MNEMMKKVKRLGLGDSVKFLGQRHDIEQLYQAFDVFCLPSLYEGLGMVLIEAQCSGLYCVTSNEVPNIVNVADIVKFCDLRNIKEWKENILIRQNTRKDFSKKLTECGYNIKKENKKLVLKYIEMEKRNEYY